MGHRKKSAPRRGSLAFVPRGRASRDIGRIRYWPSVRVGPTLLGFAGYKAGMAHVFCIDNIQGSPNYGKEVFKAATVLEAPPMKACAVRVYERDYEGLKTLTEVWSREALKDLERVLTLPKDTKFENNVQKLSDYLDRISEIRVVLSTQPRLSSVPKKKPDLMEVKVDGGSLEDQLKYASSILGKEVRISDVFKEGSLVDVISITKGKGFQGAVKRFGVKILPHKSRKTKRGVAAIGPWHPARVLYTVPRPGQLGYFQRVEYNKKILKVGSDGSEVTPKGGFIRYGLVRGDYILIEGSIPGPVKRLVKLRYPARPPSPKKTEPLKIIYVSTASKHV
ncbi:MAG: 50S ribosomal protein L3 [Candidatus Bathyarchaeia archaeon]